MLDKIKDLREKTGAGMVDCKKALEESGGDMEKAVEILRKKGIAKAAKRGEREANEGLVLVSADAAKKKAFILEVNSETDFVSRSEKFNNLVNEIFALIQSREPKTRDVLLSLAMADGNNVKDNLDHLSGVVGEKLVIKNFAVLNTAGSVASYSHFGGRIGVIVALDQAGQEDLAYDLAMQIAAANPRCVTRKEVPAGEIEKEKEIYREQLLKEGKGEAMMEKILEGKLNKYFEEICLVDQEYIKDDKKKIRDILGDTKIEAYARYSL